MVKAIIIAVGSCAALALYLFKRYGSKEARKSNLLKKIRELENEMDSVPVGSDDHNRLRSKWRMLNKSWADIVGRS